MAASKECCLNKTVGGDLYLLVDYDPARTDSQVKSRTRTAASIVVKEQDKDRGLLQVQGRLHLSEVKSRKRTAASIVVKEQDKDRGLLQVQGWLHLSQVKSRTRMAASIAGKDQDKDGCIFRR